MLDFLVAIDGPAAEALRIQAATARVTGECECGCGGISVVVDREGTPQADLGSQERPVYNGSRVSMEVLRCAHVHSYDDPEGPEATLWLTLHTKEGWITGIEISWVGEHTPKGLPSPEGFSHPR